MRRVCNAQEDTVFRLKEVEGDMLESVIAISVWLGIAFLGAVMSESKNRSALAGFLLCLFTNLVGICIIHMLDEKMVSYHYKGELSPVEPPEKENSKKPWEM